jgi:hypothetical protein
VSVKATHAKFKDFFGGVKVPELIENYDCVGFDTCLVRYKPAAIRLLVETFLIDLVKNHDYPKEILESDHSSNLRLDSTSVWDIQNGVILSLAEGSSVTQAVKGFRKLNQDEVHELYGNPPVFRNLKWP